MSSNRTHRATTIRAVQVYSKLANLDKLTSRPKCKRTAPGVFTDGITMSHRPLMHIVLKRPPPLHLSVCPLLPSERINRIQ